MLGDKSNKLIEGKIVTPDMSYSGVYLIINLLSNKFYIGSSKDLKHRMRNHFNDLKNNTHRNIHLQRAYRKNPNVFVMVVIEKVDDLNNLTNREQFWMDELNVYDKTVCYNILNKANSRLGHKLSEESRKRISDVQIGKKLSEETKRNISKSLMTMDDGCNRKKIVQLSLNGDFIRTWNSASEASRTLGFSRSAITAVCRGRYSTSGGFKWVYFDQRFEVQ